MIRTLLQKRVGEIGWVAYSFSASSGVGPASGGRLLAKGNAMERLCGSLQVDSSNACSQLGWELLVFVDEGLCGVFSTMPNG